MSLATQIQAAWQQCQAHGHPEQFDKLITQLTPYSGSVMPHVTHLEPGLCRITIEEKPELKNPFDSVHAVALINVAELASGLAMMMSLPDNVRCIITRLDTKFYKKARGQLTAECHCQLPKHGDKQEIVLTSKIFDSNQACVAELFATWQLAPEQQ